ncbi:ABC transporter permease [Aureimonas sp. AU12]|uniref:ABC transporter permease n=1 Tax=Aureimonas sp. AU12 TaxID=1638161 RepID=UPI000784186B|nr:ABC transporter permease [Aureimonas sp. AU12]
MSEIAAAGPATPTAPDAVRAAPRSDHAGGRWLLASPAILVILLAAAGPLLVVIAYSFLTPGAYGGVVWQFSTEGWLGVVAQRDIFDDSLSLADAHLSILARSLTLSFATTVVTLVLGFPTAWFIATRAPSQRNLYLFLVTIPFWTNLLIRTFAIMEVIRNEGILNTILLRLGLIDQPIQILFTDTAIMIGMAYVYLPLMVLPLYATIERLDFRLMEAAYDLYATRWRALRFVALPIVRPGLVAGAILVFIPSLGAYVTPRVLGGGRQLMLGNLIELQFGQGRNWPLGSALSITLLALVMVALLVYVRSIRDGEGAPHG